MYGTEGSIIEKSFIFTIELIPEYFMIEQPDTQDYDELLRIWELAVRSTHHFLTENDILFYLWYS